MDLATTFVPGAPLVWFTARQIFFGVRPHACTLITDVEQAIAAFDEAKEAVQSQQMLRGEALHKAPDISALREWVKK